MTTLPEVIDSFINKFKNSLNTCVPAYITEVVTEGDYIKWVSVRIVNHKAYKNGEVFKRQEITNVPVMFPSSSEGIVSFPLKVDDPVMLMFAQEDIDKFLHDGTKDESPQTFRKFSLTDAVAIPCIHPTSSSIKAHKDNFQVTFKDFKLSVTPSGETSLTTKDNVVIDAKSSVQSYREAYSVDTNKVIIGNSTVDIVSYLSDLTDEISKITVGGTPIDNKAAFETLKSLIDTIK
ncbi:MAG: putative spike protein [Prokaryotic dsDNA virus sp.]|jgi:hypothetical protein|nr:MAG: putative spike protein [Prokaryotic dsDNA virus sp.]|tara:strand:+ start:65977 stop:66678 length:702 start_codon:yes stop_codon:yes gene_type:complete